MIRYKQKGWSVTKNFTAWRASHPPELTGHSSDCAVLSPPSRANRAPGPCNSFESANTWVSRLVVDRVVAFAPRQYSRNLISSQLSPHRFPHLAQILAKRRRARVGPVAAGSHHRPVASDPSLAHGRCRPPMSSPISFNEPFIRQPEHTSYFPATKTAGS